MKKLWKKYNTSTFRMISLSLVITILLIIIDIQRGTYYSIYGVIILFIMDIFTFFNTRNRK